MVSIQQVITSTYQVGSQIWYSLILEPLQTNLEVLVHILHEVHEVHNTPKGGKYTDDS